ncbi:MAG TPA: Fic family protein [Candidatus Deferrimicrobium sp.]|nr:Fic family protein [Candidatus Deferrimicrobium sp.]
MNQYTPPFKITPRILNLCMQIAALTGRFEGLYLPNPKIELRKENQIKTIHGTVAIEGNTLTIEQITAIIEGRRVMGTEKEINEVKNAINVYNEIKTFNPYSIQDFCKAHKILMNGILPDAGKFRTESVGILKRDKVGHIGPPARLVPTHIENLFSFLKNNKEYHPLVKAAVFRYELEFIHPFSDGNGRIGRLWEHTILIDWHPLFEMVSIESIVKRNQQDYYTALGKSDKKGSSEDFIEFNLGAILNALTEFFMEFKAEPVTTETRLKIAKEKLGNRSFTRAEYLRLFKVISTATASRDLKFGVETGQLERVGDKRNASYLFR